MSPMTTARFTDLRRFHAGVEQVGELGRPKSSNLDWTGNGDLLAT